MNEPPIHYRLLRRYIDEAILAQKDRRTAMAAARLMDAGDYDIISHFDLDDNGQPIPDTLTYRVDVKAADGWAPICTVHWSRLGLEWADVEYELRNTLRQHEEGTHPGGPKDPHQRGE
jgi:hypothetical protein